MGLGAIWSVGPACSGLRLSVEGGLARMQGLAEISPHLRDPSPIYTCSVIHWQSQRLPATEGEGVALQVDHRLVGVGYIAEGQDTGSKRVVSHYACLLQLIMMFVMVTVR